MTPKEKAQDLVKKYACLARGESYADWIDRDIVFDFYDCQNALIAVDEIIKALRKDLAIFELGKGFWQDVKKEIEQL